MIGEAAARRARQDEAIAALKAERDKWREQCEAAWADRDKAREAKAILEWTRDFLQSTLERDKEAVAVLRGILGIEEGASILTATAALKAECDQLRATSEEAKATLMGWKAESAVVVSLINERSQADAEGGWTNVALKIELGERDEARAERDKLRRRAEARAGETPPSTSPFRAEVERLLKDVNEQEKSWGRVVEVSDFGKGRVAGHVKAYGRVGSALKMILEEHGSDSARAERDKLKLQRDEAERALGKIHHAVAKWRRTWEGGEE